MAELADASISLLFVDLAKMFEKRNLMPSCGNKVHCFVFLKSSSVDALKFSNMASFLLSLSLLRRSGVSARNSVQLFRRQNQAKHKQNKLRIVAKLAKANSNI